MSWYDGEKGTDAIEPDKLKDSYLYKIYARGGQVGICRKERERIVFEIARFKNGGYRLDTEIEWESDDRFGTAYATKLIEETPEGLMMKGEDDRLEYLKAAEFKLALDELENAQKVLGKARRAEEYAKSRVNMFLEEYTPKNCIRGTRGCDKSPYITVCIYPLEGELNCIYCGRDHEKGWKRVSPNHIDATGREEADETRDI